MMSIWAKENFVLRGLKSPVIGCFCLLLILGYPRFYGTNIPLAIILIPFFTASLWKTTVFLKKECLFLTGLFCMWFILGTVSYFFGEGKWEDLSFHYVLSVKLIFNLIFGFISYDIVNRNKLSLFLWILVQAPVIIASGISNRFYSFLLNFISPPTANVFENIFYVKSLGFGLVHVEGAVIFISAIFYSLVVSEKGIRLIKVSIPLIATMAMTIARSAIFPFFFLTLFACKDLKTRASILMAFLFILILTGLIASNGPFHHVTHLKGESRQQTEGSKQAYDDSIEATIQMMHKTPDSIRTWAIGDGKYFDSRPNEIQFYGKTDVGYLRLIYYAGTIFVIFYLTINLYLAAPIILNKMASPQIRGFTFALVLTFLILNMKGLVTTSVFIAMVYCHYKKVSRIIVESDLPITKASIK